MTVVNPTLSRVRFRRSGAVWLAAILTFVVVMPFSGGVFVELEGFWQAVLAPIAILAVAVPIAIAVWSLRSGVDVTAEGLTVKALFSSRYYPWNSVRGFDAEGSTVYALLESNRRLALPAVRLVDLPQLLEAGDEKLTSQDQ